MAILNKMTPPTTLTYDHPYMTEWRYVNDEGITQIWVNCGSETEPNWRRAGDIFEEIVVESGFEAYVENLKLKNK